MTISQYNKKWPFKKQKCTRTTPRQHLVPLQNIHATQRLTSYDHMTYLERNTFKGFTNSDKKTRVQRNRRCKYGVIHPM